jgi:predicted nucleotidyltransferase
VTRTIQTDLSNITAKIGGILPGARVFLFGSYATGKQKTDSDLDLCVIAPRFPMRRMEMIHAIRDAIVDQTSLPIDILLFSEDEFAKNSSMKPTIEYRVAREGVLLHA